MIRPESYKTMGVINITPNSFSDGGEFNSFSHFSDKFSDLINNYDVIDDREKGLRAALDITLSNDIVIIFGKGREEYQEINGEFIPYSDVKIINEYSHEN